MDEQTYLERLHALCDKNWPEGVSAEVDYIHGEKPLAEYLRAWAQSQPAQPAIIFYGRVLTYQELDQMSDRFAAVLAEHGVQRGDRVSVFMPNCPQFHIAFFGIAKLGAVHAPVSPLSKAFELSYQLKDSGAKAIVAHDQLMPIVREAQADDSDRTVFVTTLSDFLPEKPTISVPETAQEPKHRFDGTVDLLSAIDACDNPVPQIDVGMDDLAQLNYTSGTTGMPKGCMHTHRDLVYTGAANCSGPFKLGPGDVTVCFFPEFWIAGENLGLVFPTFSGSTVLQLTRWDPVGFMEAVSRYKATATWMLVDSAVELMEHPRAAEFDLSSLRLVRAVSFVKKNTVDYRKRWREWTGSTISEVSWGMTETHTSNTFTTGMQTGDFDLKSQPVFVGLPVPGTEFKVCDFETAELLPLGSEGELCVRTPSLFKGYWQKPEATAKALQKGWLRTGDIGLIDEEGYIHFLGRRKEMLKVKGMSVFPAEIETILGQNGDVEASAVVGSPDPDKGQVPVAFVLPKRGATISPDELEAWCRAHMAVHKVPRIKVVDTLPMTATGKIRKTELEKTVNERA
ncbi:MAG TPA: AMP-binding protein [Gammaproteobacteria bacterium]|nr:AMP-binding protein [Gammaproteobacteria bacterium]